MDDDPHTSAHGALGHRLKDLLGAHRHDTSERVDSAMETSREGMRALGVSLVVLAGAGAIEAAVVSLSGSVALLGDTLHNFADALTAVPLGVAFVVGRRAANRRYTYGYGRAEDLAGIVVVAVVAASCVAVAYESVDHLVHPHPVHVLWGVAVAATVGLAANEVAAHYRMSVGRRIGSAALVADGRHARADGLSSLAVLLGAILAAAGFDRADPIIGLVIALAIGLVLRGAARDVYRRLMDSVDPELLDQATNVLSEVGGVQGVGQLRMRWIGHALRAEVEIVVDESLTVANGHAIAEEARHALLHAVPRLTAAIVHADPCGHTGADPHGATAHHTET